MSGINAGFGIGAGQAWQGLTASRAFATTYINTTGKPILVAVTSQATSAACGIVANIDGANIYRTRSGVVSGGLFQNCLCFIVPSGSEYKVTEFESGILYNWAELR